MAWCRANCKCHVMIYYVYVCILIDWLTKWMSHWLIDQFTDSLIERLVDCCYVHDDVIKCEHFPHYWLFVRRIHCTNGQWRWALMFPLICIWIHGWVNNGEAGDLRCHCSHYDITVIHFQLKPHKTTPLLKQLNRCVAYITDFHSVLWIQQYIKSFFWRSSRWLFHIWVIFEYKI